MKNLGTLAASILPPAYHDARRVQQDAEQRLVALSPPAAIDPALDPLSIGEVTDAWLAAAVQREEHLARNGHQRVALMRLMTDARSSADQIHTAAVDTLLTAFNGELQSLLREVEQLSDELGAGVNTAARAIANDVGAQWKRLTELADDYAELRRAQLKLVPPDVQHAARAPANADPTATDLHLSNLDALWEHWRNPSRLDGQLIQLGAGHKQPRREPWPEDGTELLLWLVRSEADAWVPTLAQLRRHGKERANPAAAAEDGFTPGRPDQRPPTQGWQPIGDAARV